MTEIRRPRYVVILDDGTEHTVTITHQDMLRAEQAGARLGLPSVNEATMTGATLWCWAALRREGVLEVKPQTFLNETCQGMRRADETDDTDEEGLEVVDPTRLTPDIDYASDSPPTTPAASLTG